MPVCVHACMHLKRQSLCLVGISMYAHLNSAVVAWFYWVVCVGGGGGERFKSVTQYVNVTAE